MKFSKPAMKVAGGLLLSVFALALVAPKTVHALAATLVQVTNTSTNPVVNQDVDSPGRSPYYQTVGCYSSSTNQCTASFTTVPANKRLVVQFIASSIDTPTALQTGEFFANGPAFIPILYTQQASDPAGNKIYIADQPMLYYFEAGQSPYFVMNAASANFTFMSGSVTLTGYYVNNVTTP
jgi:hypothetical protein